MNESLKERNKALSNMDLAWARKNVLTEPQYSDAVLIIGMHKARYECVQIVAELRHISGAWLRENGYKRLYGLDLLPEGELPE